jgi:hypothetical protein
MSSIRNRFVKLSKIHCTEKRTITSSGIDDTSFGIDEGVVLKVSCLTGNM